MKTKGKFLFKRTWYSFCSMHSDHDINCPTCNAGKWHYNICITIEKIVYYISPKIWKYFINKF